MVDYRLGPDVAGAIQLGESIRARKAQQARDDLMLQEARRKIAMEQQVGQFLPGALQGDTNALAALFRISPDRGMAVTNWLATQQQRDLQRQVTEARLAKIRGGGVGSGGGGPVVPAVNPWGMPSGGPAPAPMRSAPTMPAGPPAAIPGATSAVPLRMSGAPSFADTAGADEPPMPTGGSGLDDEEAPDAPAMSISTGQGGRFVLTMPSAQPTAGQPSGEPVEPVGGPLPTKGPAASGLPADMYEARAQGYVAILDRKGSPKREAGYVEMWKPGVPGSGILVPVERKEKQPARWRPDPSRPGVLINEATGDVKRDPSHRDAKPLTEQQAKDYSYALRLARAIPELEKMAYAGERPTGAERFMANEPTIMGVPITGGALRSVQAGLAPESAAKTQRFDQLSRDIINAILRRESGAVISDQEFDNARRQYIPQPSDTPEVVKRKLENLRTTLEAIAIGSGRPDVFGFNERPSLQAPQVRRPPLPQQPEVPPASAAPTGQPQPNERHIDYLKRNPQFAPQFDAKFGPGASRRYLEGR